MDTANDRITSHLNVLAGKPVVRGTRIPVSLILNFVGNGMSFQQILEEYPQLTREDLQSALRYAAAVVDANVAIGERQRIDQ